MKKIFLIILFAITCIASNAQTAIKTPEEESDNAVQMGNAKAENGDWKGALNDYTNALGYNKKNQVAYLKRGLAEQNLRDYRSAVMDYSKAISLNNSDGDAYYGRGLSYYNLGMKDKCCLDLTKATELGNQDANSTIQNYCN